MEIIVIENSNENRPWLTDFVIYKDSYPIMQELVNRKLDLAILSEKERKESEEVKDYVQFE